MARLPAKDSDPCPDWGRGSGECGGRIDKILEVEIVTVDREVYTLCIFVEVTFE
jgi:hypothetical protein